MKSNRKQGIYEISLTASKTVLFVLLAFCGFVFVFYGLIKRGDIIQSEPVNFVENWDVAYSENGDQTLTTTLPADVKANEYLFLETRNDVSVYIDGVLRKDFIEERDINTPGGSFSRFLMFVPLSESDAGRSIIVYRIAPQAIDKKIPEFPVSLIALSFCYDMDILTYLSY